MKLNKWTWALAATGVVSLGSVAFADEHPVNTMLASTTLYGYVDTSAVWNFGHGNAVAPRFLNTGPDRQDGFNLNAVKVALEKPLDEGTWSAGYKVESILGPDAAYFGGKDIGLKQAYVALRAPVGNGIDFKVGRFDPIIGYEVFDSIANPNFARSFGYYLEPASHTGVLATYQFSEVLGVAAGVGNAEDTLTASNPTHSQETRKSYMGAVTIKAPQSSGWLAGSALYAGIVDTAHGHPSEKDKLNLYVGGTLSTPITGFTVGAAYDYVDHVNYASGNAHAVALYASYAFNEQLKLNVRPEWARFAGRTDLFGLTATVDYQLWANVVTRLEFRWDHTDRGSFETLGVDSYYGGGYSTGASTEDGTGGVGGAGNGGLKNDLSLLLNIVYKF